MERKPLASYRVLFWVSMLLTAFSATFLYIAHQRLNYVIRNIADPRLFDPHKLSALRDINYPFTIEVYGYKYQGATVHAGLAGLVPILPIARVGQRKSTRE